MDVLPSGLIRVIVVFSIFTGVLLVLFAGIGWLHQNPAILVILIAALIGGVFLALRRKRARTTV